MFAVISDPLGMRMSSRYPSPIARCGIPANFRMSNSNRQMLAKATHQEGMEASIYVRFNAFSLFRTALGDDKLLP